VSEFALLLLAGLPSGVKPRGRRMLRGLTLLKLFERLHTVVIVLRAVYKQKKPNLSVC
jgi:hypothetical protein